MTGNFYVLLTLAEVVVSYLPAAARRSRAIVRRTSNRRTALIGTVTAWFRGTRSGRRHFVGAVPIAACAEESLSP